MRVLSDDVLFTLWRDDFPYGDITSDGLGVDTHVAVVSFCTREKPLVVACTEEAARLCELAGLEVESMVASGTFVKGQTPFLTAKGDAKNVLAVVKSVQNLLDYSSGMATYTHDLVTQVKKINPSCQVGTTRKTPPFLKSIVVKSVTSGGAIIHRLGLSESILIFREHRCFFDENCFKEALEGLKKKYPEHKIMIEADTQQEAMMFASWGVDIVQLEKFDPSTLMRVVKGLQNNYPSLGLTATGGITTENITTYAQSGVDMIVTSAPYNAPMADIKVMIKKG